MCLDISVVVHSCLIRSFASLVPIDTLRLITMAQGTSRYILLTVSLCFLSLALHMLLQPLFAPPSLHSSTSPASGDSACPYADALGLNDKTKTQAEKTAILKRAMPASHPPVGINAQQSQCPHLQMTSKQAGIQTGDAEAPAEETQQERERREQIQKDEAEGRLTTTNTVYEHVEGIDIDEF